MGRDRLERGRERSCRAPVPRPARRYPRLRPATSAPGRHSSPAARSAWRAGFLRARWRPGTDRHGRASAGRQWRKLSLSLFARHARRRHGPVAVRRRRLRGRRRRRGTEHREMERLELVVARRGSGLLLSEQSTPRGLRRRNGSSLVRLGTFQTAGGQPIQFLARWNGSSWSQVGGGVNSPCFGIGVANDGSGPALFVGGVSTLAGNTVVAGVAKWGPMRPGVSASQPTGPGGAVIVSDIGLVAGRDYANVFSFDICAGGPGSGPYLGLCAQDVGASSRRSCCHSAPSRSASSPAASRRTSADTLLHRASCAISSAWT